MADPRLGAITPSPRERQEAARLLVEHGRWWLMPLPEHDIERASIAVVRDPQYRKEMRRDAYQRAAEPRDNELLARLIGAAMLLDNADFPFPLNAPCPHCGSDAGERCVSASGRQTTPHEIRRSPLAQERQMEATR